MELLPFSTLKKEKKPLRLTQALQGKWLESDHYNWQICQLPADPALWFSSPRISTEIYLHTRHSSLCTQQKIHNLNDNKNVFGTKWHLDSNGLSYFPSNSKHKKYKQRLLSGRICNQHIILSSFEVLVRSDHKSGYTWIEFRIPSFTQRYNGQTSIQDEIKTYSCEYPT